MRVGLLIMWLQCSALSFGKVVKLAPLESEEGYLESETEHGRGMVGSSEEDSSADGSAVLRKPTDSLSGALVGEQNQRVTERRVEGAKAVHQTLPGSDKKEKNKAKNVKAKSGTRLRKVHELLQDIKHIAKVKDTKQQRKGAKTSQTKVVTHKRPGSRAPALARLVTVSRDYLKLCKPYKALMEQQKRRRLLRLLFGFASPARPARMQKITLGHIEKYSKRCALPQYPWGYPWQPPGAQVSDKTPELPGQHQQLSSHKGLPRPGFP